MRWTEEVAERKLAKVGKDGGGGADGEDTKGNKVTSGHILAAAAVAVGATALWRHAGGEIRERVGGFWSKHIAKHLPARLRRRKGHTTGRANRHAKRPISGAAHQARAAETSSLPRNKQPTNNKKNKKRKQDKQVKAAIKREAEKDKAAQPSKGDVKEANKKAKEVEEMTEEEKTFTTHSRWTMPEKYAKMGKNS